MTIIRTVWLMLLNTLSRGYIEELENDNDKKTSQVKEQEFRLTAYTKEASSAYNRILDRENEIRELKAEIRSLHQEAQGTFLKKPPLSEASLVEDKPVNLSYLPLRQFEW